VYAPDKEKSVRSRIVRDEDHLRFTSAILPSRRVMTTSAIPAASACELRRAWPCVAPRQTEKKLENRIAG